MLLYLGVLLMSLRGTKCSEEAAPLVDVDVDVRGAADRAGLVDETPRAIDPRALFYRSDDALLKLWNGDDDDKLDDDDDDAIPGMPGVDVGADPSRPSEVRDDNLVEGLCSLTADEYRDAVLSLVVFEMTAAGFDTSYWTERSYPAQALDWTANQDPLVICPTSTSSSSTERLVQRFLLVLLYLQLSGSSWNERSGWMTGSSECNWYGVECDSSGRVTRVSLKRNGLRGRLPPQIMAIPQLQALSLDHNSIGGTLPPSVGGARNLQVLELDDNRINGTIPSELYTLVQLQALDLNSNMLSGTLSRRIENLSNLVVLQLEQNRLTGPVPTSSLQKLNDLVLLTLHGNSWAAGSSLGLLCEYADVRRTSNPAYVQFLSLDCSSSAGSSAFTCPCCTQC